jgi:hypothetical protein
VILGLRLKIEGGKKISEMEVLALRKTSGVFSEPQNLVDKPIFHQALAPSERRPRAELIRVANSYFEGMEGCGAQFATGFTKVITRVEERRFPVVDEERGMVLSIYSLRSLRQKQNHHLGRRYRVNPPFDQPYSFFVAEPFKIVDGKINRIEALVTPVPYGMYAGWPQEHARK